jgi:prepilin-type N-terminal cleavage/methylation domain-containing protein
MCIQSKSKQAFTLVELLVVISIILIASSIIFIGGKGGDGSKLTASQRIVSGISQGARGQAILKNAKTRLIIYSDKNTVDDDNLDKVLRFFGIVYWGTDKNGDEGWLPATQGTYLPEGIYFNPTGAPKSGSNPWTDSNRMKLDYPRVKAGNNTDEDNGGTGSDDYYYWQFESNGTMDSDFANSWLVLQAGSIKFTAGSDGGDSSYDIDFSDSEKENLLSALIFRRMGTTTRVDDPSEISVTAAP